MNLAKLVAPLALGISLLTHSPQIKAEEPKYFSSFQFGGYIWSSPNLEKYVKDSPMLKTGFGTKINSNLEAKFSTGYIFGKKTFSIGEGVSETIDINALYLDAMVDYLIPVFDGGEVYFGAGISAMSFKDNITISDGRTANEAASSLGIPINIGTIIALTKDRNIQLEGNSGINLHPFNGADFSGSFVNFGVRFKF